jgi:uncharacterized Fe-S center protein
MGEEDCMKKVVFFTDIAKLGESLDHFPIEGFSGKKIPFKLNMGEIANRYYPKADFIKLVIEELKKRNVEPFLYDTTVAYFSPRYLKVGYEVVAKMHGYGMLECKVVVDNSGVNVSVEGCDYEVGENLYNATHIFAFSHVKGHIATGMSGAIKNLGMGGVTKKTKIRMHHASNPIYQRDACTFCGKCSEQCPVDAIKVSKSRWELSEGKCVGCGVCVENCDSEALINKDKDLQYFLACAAKACIQDKNVIYVNDVNRISRSCDCDPFAGPLICPDIGFLVSDDIVAVDKASLDLVNVVRKDVFIETNKVDPVKQIKRGEMIGLGSPLYKLISI